LTHGAGGDCNTPLLCAVADAFRERGVTVLRFDLPFRQTRPKGPPGPADAARDRTGIKLALDALRPGTKGSVFLGGLSYGGRQATMLAAEEPRVADGLLLLSYPLHAPGKPDQPRKAHFSNLRAPSTFVHGTGDPFGTIAEIDGALALIPAPHRLIVVEGAGHDLKRGRFDLAPVVESVLSPR
jgi:uncharacterized protein